MTAGLSSRWFRFCCTYGPESYRLLVLILFLVNLSWTGSTFADDEFQVFGSRVESAAYDDGILLTSIDWPRSNIPGTTLIWTTDGTARPKLQGRLRGTYGPQEMAVTRPYVFLLQDRTLKVYNLTAPGKPYQAHQLELDFDAVAIHAIEGQLWVHGEKTLSVFRFSPIEGLVRMGSLESNATISALHADGSRVYLDLKDQGLARVVGTAGAYRLDVIHTLAEGRVVSVEDQKAFVDSSGDLTIVDLSGNVSIVVNQVNLGEGEIALVQDQKAFLMRDTLKIFDLKNPGPPLVVSDADIDLGFERVSFAFPFGKLLLIGTHHSGLRFYSLEDLPLPQPQLYWNHLDYSADLVVRNGHVYVANGHAGVAVFKDGSELALLSSLDTPGFVVDLASSGSLLFIADEFAGLMVADIANPRNPKVLARYEIDQGALDLAVHGNRLYVAGKSGELHAFEFKSDGSLQSKGQWNLGVNKVCVTADGRVYAGGFYREVYHLQFSGMNSPPSISKYYFAVTGIPMSLEAFGNEVYVAAWKEGFAFFTADGVWHPLPWEIFSSYSSIFHIRDIAFHDNKLYLATGTGTILVANPQALTSPSQEDPWAIDWTIGSAQVNGSTYALALEGSRLYVLTEERLLALDIGSAGPPIQKGEALLPVYPGPAL